MELPVHLLEVPAIDVGVDLRRRDAGVAEHLLDGAEVRAAFEEVRREGVAQRVGVDVLLDAGESGVFLYQAPDVDARKRLAAAAEE